jgi:hypothetical protein
MGLQFSHGLYKGAVVCQRLYVFYLWFVFLSQFPVFSSMPLKCHVLFRTSLWSCKAAFVRYFIRMSTPTNFVLFIFISSTDVSVYSRICAHACCFIEYCRELANKPLKWRGRYEYEVTDAISITLGPWEYNNPPPPSYSTPLMYEVTCYTLYFPSRAWGTVPIKTCTLKMPFRIMLMM